MIKTHHKWNSIKLSKKDMEKVLEVCDFKIKDYQKIKKEIQESLDKGKENIEMGNFSSKKNIHRDLFGF